MTNVYFMPVNCNIQLADIERSEDKDLIYKLLDLGMLILLFCSVKNEDDTEVKVVIKGAYKDTYNAGLALDNTAYYEWSAWTELVSHKPFEEWNCDWEWNKEVPKKERN